MNSLPTETARSEKTIWLFLAGWTALNALQAGTLGLHSDEAYYWIYSRFLAWGYYDHPPMVALFIRAGYALFQNEFGLRLITVISSTIALRLLWLTVRRYNHDPWQFILITGGVFIFHVYGFITTPDAPLFFFTILFYYFFERYLRADRWQSAILIALTLACLLYSKYHGILIIGFTLLANIRLLKRRSFWLIPLLTALLYLPHIWWQISHGYPSVQYHLFERSSQVYDFAHTYLFIPGQLLMAGPLIGWFLFVVTGKVKVKDVFIRTLLVNCVATFLFFLISTLKGNVQPHWTLIAFVPLAMLTLIFFGQQQRLYQWFRNLAVDNLIVIVLVRLALAAGIPAIQGLGPVKNFFGYREWANQIKAKAGDAHVIFTGGFQEPSKYDFYTPSLKGFSYDTRYYRRTQFELWPLEGALQHQRTLFITDTRDTGLVMDSLQTVKGKFYTAWVDDTRTYQRVDIKSDGYKFTAKPGQTVTFHLTISNPYPYAINFSNDGQKNRLYFGACFLQGDGMPYAQRANADFYRISLQPHQTVNYTFPVIAPKRKGRYELIFSLRTTPFAGGRNSRMINFTVE